MSDIKQHPHASGGQTGLLAPMTSSDPDIGYNENQAATFLGVSARTLQAWRVRGGGPEYVKMGRTVRYQRRTLISYQEAHTVGSTTEADAKEGGR